MSLMQLRLLALILPNESIFYKIHAASRDHETNLASRRRRERKRFVPKKIGLLCLFKIAAPREEILLFDQNRRRTSCCIPHRNISVRQIFGDPTRGTIPPWQDPHRHHPDTSPMFNSDKHSSCALHLIACLKAQFVARHSQ
jgi:hypothetical protein